MFHRHCILNMVLIFLYIEPLLFFVFWILITPVNWNISDILLIFCLHLFLNYIQTYNNKPSVNTSPLSFPDFITTKLICLSESNWKKAGWRITDWCPVWFMIYSWLKDVRYEVLLQLFGANDICWLNSIWRQVRMNILREKQSLNLMMGWPQRETMYLTTYR